MVGVQAFVADEFDKRVLIAFWGHGAGGTGQVGMDIGCSIRAGIDAGNGLLAFVVPEVRGTGSFAEHQDIAVGVSEAADIDGVVGSYLAAVPEHAAEAACQGMVLILGGLQDGLGSDAKEFPVVQGNIRVYQRQGRTGGVGIAGTIRRCVPPGKTVASLD